VASIKTTKSRRNSLRVYCILWTVLERGLRGQGRFRAVPKRIFKIVGGC